MKRNLSIKTLLACVLIPLAGGLVTGFAVRDSTWIYETLERPPLSPPPAVFPVVWTILYIMMGLALYGVLTSGAGEDKKQNALRAFTSQLLVNYLWPIVFFVFRTYWAAAVCLVFLIVLVAIVYIDFRKIDRASSLLLLPYMAWLIFALYLNIGVAVLN